ncbi:MAG: PRD domain-containing protein [Lachnospiraceae bacterium]|nr:PRD domain-containing protein [Lachnospiraceae bacterium]MDE6185194.1 PRD domain-containing protein [Lachnospiraceae bacterium]
MEVIKIINNNVVSCVDKDGRELVVMGKGIGFGKKPGHSIEENLVEKIFRMDNKDSLERFKELLSNIPLEYVQLSNEIIAFAKSSIGIELNQNVYLTLIDHIHFAIERFKKNMHFANALFGEIKLFYPKEYLVGKYALRLIEEKTGLQMPDDEAASIALHLVNAEYDSRISDTFRMTEMIREMFERIENKFPQFIENSMHKDWLASNLKYMAHRLLKIEPVEGLEDEEYQSAIRKNCIEECSVADDINAFLVEKYQCSMTTEEKLYLAISIKRTRDTYKI